MGEERHSDRYGSLYAKRLEAAVLDIDAHATPFGEDEDGFVTGGYLISVGALHRALGVVGHTAPKCGRCEGSNHDCADMVGIYQRIRAGWLPHRLSGNQSWWWGRPRHDDGFRFWVQGLVPSMSVVEPMTTGEVHVWVTSLHPMAPEAAHIAKEPDRG